MVFAPPASYILDQHGVSVFQRYSPQSRRERRGYAEKKFKIGTSLPGLWPLRPSRWNGSFCALLCLNRQPLELIELNSQRRALEENIVHAGLRRHKADLIRTIVQ